MSIHERSLTFLGLTTILFTTTNATNTYEQKSGYCYDSNGATYKRYTKSGANYDSCLAECDLHEECLGFDSTNALRIDCDQGNSFAVAPSSGWTLVCYTRIYTYYTVLTYM